MRTVGTRNIWRAAAGVGAAVALVVTAACSSGEDFARVRAAGDNGFVPVAQQMGNANGQVLVNCEPQQRTLVRQVVVNGQPASQVDCVTAAGAPAGYVQNYAPAYNTPRAYPVDYGNETRIVSPAPVYRPASTTQRREVVDRQTRSVKKSAIIIGSSAGVGAGVGAAVGGKKGALLGAVIGGGGATLWDQLTRHK
jgi:hypothetical protein